MNLLLSGASGFVSQSVLNYINHNHTSIHKIGLITTNHNGFEKYDSIFDKFLFYTYNDFFSCSIDVKFDTYIHGMSQPKGSLNRSENNLNNLNNALNCIASIGVNNIVCLSSGAVYKKKLCKFNENDPMVTYQSGAYEYGLYKAKEESLVRRFCQTNNINFIILRLFSFAGSLLFGRAEFAIIDFLTSALKFGNINVKNPQAVRSYMHQYDLGGAVTKIILDGNARNKVINIGSSDAISMKDLGNKISKITSSSIFFESDKHIDFYVPNVDRQQKFYKNQLNDIDFIIEDLMRSFKSYKAK